ncbi:DUF262 domain-containing protein [Dactylosporangium sp. NPDC006015]|uniref:DUF262 domain-containing protein n=1 Tax=Dactylosporangium sp. NPDC006015 TaxID=3154576 RepID=UPI0033ACDBBF
MRLDPWEPDIRTLISRLAEREIDLQPDFQRGIAWNEQKQAKLIDTILRGWSVPPMHFLVYSNETMAVLDGQQRLTSIWRFVRDKIRVGEFLPVDPRLAGLAGKLFSELDTETQRRINNYTIRSYRLHDYMPEEPHELFFRLNQPTGLTQAEKRNALMGSSRSQVRQLTKYVEQLGWDRQLIGFENARLAYDDILARACVYLQEGTLRISTNAARLEQQFRSADGFAQKTVERLYQTVELLTDQIRPLSGSIRLNKATLLSWLLFFARGIKLGVKDWSSTLLHEVEIGRAEVRKGGLPGGRPTVMNSYLALYDDRASLRVADILSVVARDACLWRVAAIVQPELEEFEQIRGLLSHLKRAETQVNFEASVLGVLDRNDVWGDL